jgi:hypothetical protein
VDRHGHIGTIRVTAETAVLVLKRHGAWPRLDPEQVAGHSLRAGLLTSTVSAGVPERAIAAQTDSRGTTMLRRYIRESSLFSETAAGVVGL